MGDLAKLLAKDSNGIIVTLGLLILEAFYLILLLQLAKFRQPSQLGNNVLKNAVGIIFILSIITLNPLINIVDDKVPWLIADCSAYYFMFAGMLCDSTWIKRYLF